MTKSELIANIKASVWWMKLDYDKSWWQNKIDTCLRKHTQFSGKTKIIKIDGAATSYTFTTDQKVHCVVHVYPWYDQALNLTDFNVFGEHYLWDIFQNTSIVADLEYVVLKKSFLSALRSAFGKSMDFYFDPDTKIMVVNQNLTYTSLVVEYLPIWSLKNDDTDNINDSVVLDWVTDWVVWDVKADIFDIMDSGTAFDLPVGAASFSAAKDEKKDMEKSLRSRYPLLGMSRR